MRVKDMVLFKPQIIGEKDIDGGTELVSRVFGMESYMIVESDCLGLIAATLNHPFNSSLDEWCPDNIETQATLNYLKNKIMDRIEGHLRGVHEAGVKQGLPYYQESVQFNISKLCPIKFRYNVKCCIRLDRQSFCASMEVNCSSVDPKAVKGEVFKSALWAIRRKLFEGVC